jgi:hypothetical protein
MFSWLAGSVGKCNAIGTLHCMHARILMTRQHARCGMLHGILYACVTMASAMHVNSKPKPVGCVIVPLVWTLHREPTTLVS